MEEQQALAWLSEPRYQRFFDAAGGEHERTVALYEWHAELTTASFGLIHLFEVVLRNAIDRVLGDGQPQAPIKDTWLLDFETLHPDGIKQVIIAIERLEKGKGVTRGRVIAGVSFAFWAGLFGRRYEELWRHRLRAAFPPKPSRARISAPGCAACSAFAIEWRITIRCWTRIPRGEWMTC